MKSLKSGILTLSLLLSFESFTQDNSKHFFVFLNRNPDRVTLPEEEAKKLQEGHMNNINRLADEGILLAAGPFEDGGGIFIFQAGSLDEVDSLLQTDPAIQANRFILETYEWRQMAGGLCDVGEDYTMTFRKFIRFTPSNIRQVSLAGSDDLIKNHYTNFTTGDSIVAGGLFVPEQGEILILRDGADAEKVASEHPMVKNGIWTYGVRRLYIADGSFCE